MTEFDICRDYRLAKNKRQQIKILADRNVCGIREIQEILARNGLYSGKLAAPRPVKPEGAKRVKRRDSLKWTPEMVNTLLAMRERGYKTGDIAESLGINPKQVTQKTYDLTKRGKQDV